MLLLDSLELNYKLIRRKFKPYLHNRQLKEELSIFFLVTNLYQETGDYLLLKVFMRLDM